MSSKTRPCALRLSTAYQIQDWKDQRVPRGQIAPLPASCVWPFDVLVGKTPTVTWAPAGMLPPRFEVAERFAVVPAGRGRSFMVSLATARASASALTSYNALRPARRRIARRVLGFGLRTGLAQPLLAHKVEVGIAAGTAAEQLADSLVSEHLRGLFNRRVVTAFGGSDGPYRKPVLQIFGRDGTPLGYAKVGWNDWTRNAVRREATALRLCASRPLRLGVPALLDHSAWRGLELLVTAPLPRRVRRLREGSPLPEVGLLREISELAKPHGGELAASPWWLGLRARISGCVADPAARTRLELLADQLERSYGRATLMFGAWHGDFVPWNLARLGNRLYAWDWESSAQDAPVGFDALHFHFQVAFVARRYPLSAAAALADQRARSALAALGVPTDRHQLVATLHLVELFVRHEQARSSSGGVDERFYPAVAHVLEESMTGPSTGSRPHPVREVS